MFVTLKCTSFEEVEGQINSLQGELNEIREQARRAPFGIHAACISLVLQPSERIARCICEVYLRKNQPHLSLSHSGLCKHVLIRLEPVNPKPENPREPDGTHFRLRQLPHSL